MQHWSATAVVPHPQSHPKPKPKVTRPKGPNKHITFFGQDFFNASLNHTFDVLAGDQPPRIVGGYADWATIKRPLRRSLTIFQGYDPISMEVHIRFIQFNPDDGSWLTGNGAGLAIEEKIATLEWMAGEGHEVGPSPLVYLSTFDNSGQTTPLIPFQYQGTTPANPRLFGGGFIQPWIIMGGIQWDPNPIRNDSGYRIRQDASMTMMIYQGPSSSSSTQKGKARPKATIFHSRAGADTALLIARNETTAFPSALATAIIKAPQNKGLRLRSINQKIKFGKKVTVPAGN